MRNINGLPRRASDATAVWLMAGLLGVVFAVWVWNLGYGVFTGDEIFVTQLTHQPVAQILSRLNIDEPHPPVYYLMIRGWRLLVGRPNEITMRLPSVWVGLVLLSLVYRLGRDLGLGWWGACAAALLIAVCPQVLVHVRELRMYGPMLATAVFATLVGWRFPRWPHRWSVPLAVLASLLALSVQYFNAVFIGVLAAWGAVIFTGSVRRRWILSQAIALGALAIWLPLMGRGFFNSTSLQQGKTWSFLLPPWETLARLAMVGVFGYRDYSYVPWAAAGGALLAGLWLAGSLTAGRQTRWLLFGMAAVPLVAYAVLCWFKPLFHPKYVLPWLAFAALAVGALIARWRTWGTALWALLLIFMVWPAWRTLSLPYAPNLDLAYDSWLRPDQRDMALSLNLVMGATDVFGLGQPDWLPCFYTQDYLPRNLGCQVLPASPQQTTDELAAQIQQTLSTHRLLWFMDYYNPDWDPNHVAEAALARSALDLGTERFAGHTLNLYASPETIVREALPVQVRLGDTAVLEGAWAVDGPNLRLALVWTAQGQAAPGLKVFVHLEDATGAIVAQADRGWMEGAESYATHWLTVYTLPRPAGADISTLNLALGLYDGATLQRLPAYRQTGERLPDDAVVVPLASLVRP